VRHKCRTVREIIGDSQYGNTSFAHLKLNTLLYLCTKLTAGMSSWIISEPKDATRGHISAVSPRWEMVCLLTIRYPDSFKVEVQVFWVAVYVIRDIYNQRFD
jgi:hypothetical protein